jgi:predicted component of type VI protein secretion system
MYGDTTLAVCFCVRSRSCERVRLPAASYATQLHGRGWTAAPSMHTQLLQNHSMLVSITMLGAVASLRTYNSTLVKVAKRRAACCTRVAAWRAFDMEITYAKQISVRRKAIVVWGAGRPGELRRRYNQPSQATRPHTDSLYSNTLTVRPGGLAGERRTEGAPR